LSSSASGTTTSPVSQSGTQASTQASQSETQGSKRPKKKSKATEVYWKGYECLEVNEIMGEQFKKQNYRISAILLHVKVNHAKKAVNTYFSKKDKGSTLNAEMQYDRIFMFGCLGQKTCFVVISRTPKQSFNLLEDFINSNKVPCIGQTVVLVEPVFSERTLGKDNNLPIFELKKAFSLYQFSKVPDQPYEIPKEPITRYFILHEMSIEVTLATMQKSFCAGYLCDKQMLRGQDRTCCCLYNTGVSPLVLEVVVKVYDGEEGGEKELIVSTHDFRSWVFSNLVIDGMNNVTAALDDFSRENEGIMRAKIEQIVQYVNNHNGWTVIGWVRRGTQVDASVTGTRASEDEITAETVSPHIIRLVPTNVKMEELVEKRYKKVYRAVDLV
jgi:hypothetical protein